MPLYEYKCRKCGHIFEKIQPVTAPTTQRCPKCGAKAERQLAAPAIQFKGTGWYVTDYASKSGSGASSGEKSGDGKTAKTTEKPGPSKTADSGKSESGTKKKKE